jgi:hypothetical protein
MDGLVLMINLSRGPTSTATTRRRQRARYDLDLEYPVEAKAKRSSVDESPTARPREPPAPMQRLDFLRRAVLGIAT